jgi:hypothetical protein
MAQNRRTFSLHRRFHERSELQKGETMFTTDHRQQHSGSPIHSPSASAGCPDQPEEVTPMNTPSQGAIEQHGGR